VSAVFVVGCLSTPPESDNLGRGCEAYCIYEGYEGLVRGGDLIKKADWDDVRGYLPEGGTLIGTARCSAFRERWGRLAAAKNMVAIFNGPSFGSRRLKPDRSSTESTHWWSAAVTAVLLEQTCFATNGPDF
jgi:hypothetical protein